MFDPWVVLSNLSDPVTLLLMTLSACFGIIMGAVPGLSGTLGIALLLPFTFGLESATAPADAWFRVLRLRVRRVHPFHSHQYSGNGGGPLSRTTFERIPYGHEGASAESPFYGAHFVGVRRDLRRFGAPVSVRAPRQRVHGIRCARTILAAACSH